MSRLTGRHRSTGQRTQFEELQQAGNNSDLLTNIAAKDAFRSTPDLRLAVGLDKLPEELSAIAQTSSLYVSFTPPSPKS